MREPLESAFLTLLIFGVDAVYGEAEEKKTTIKNSPKMHILKQFYLVNDNKPILELQSTCVHRHRPMSNYWLT